MSTNDGSALNTKDMDLEMYLQIVLLNCVRRLFEEDSKGAARCKLK